MADTMRPGLVCVECGASVVELVRDYGKGNLRLAICSACNSVADKYVEYETILLFLEVLLLKPQVYRHVLCNLPAPVSTRTTLKLFVILVMLDMNVKAYLVDRDAGVTFRSESMYRTPEIATSGARIGQFSLHLVCLALVENVVYFVSVFTAIWMDPFRRKWREKLLEDGVDAAWTRYASAMCISSFGKLFALLTVIWEFHWSFIHVIGALVVVSNVLALQLLLGEGNPARAKSLHVVAVVVFGLIARGAAQLALYAMGNSSRNGDQEAVKCSSNRRPSMSTVELPLVPSARSSNSSTSSRSNLHSAGSINSEKSAKSVRSQRSLYRQENDEDDAQSGEEETYEEEPQESSGGLWDEVEHFLNKPSPSFSKLSGKTSKTAVSKLPQSTLPTLNGRRASPDNQATKPSRPARATSTGPKTIDPKLLQEAFAYANQLQQLNFEDEGGEEQQQSWRNNKTKMLMQRAALGRTNSSSSVSSIGPNGRAGGAKASSGGARKKKAKGTSSSVYSSAVKPKPALRKTRSKCEENPSSASTESKAKSKGHMDPQTLQALVSNFQNGTTLDELRRELVASQQSMAMSRQVLQNAAQNFFQPH
ncbi:hypothetical protein PC123_g13008 [Phytophthora cactorum]|nr:hypothetical protein PC123_g13008 [Phytophthora cactorum]